MSRPSGVSAPHLRMSGSTPPGASERTATSDRRLYGITTRNHTGADVVMDEAGRAEYSARRPSTPASFGEALPERVVGRFGGEEYVALLRSTDTAHATATAQRIRAAVEALAVPIDTSAGEVTVDTLNVSIGVATQESGPTVRAAAGHPTSSELDTLLLAADTALYQAERDGHNRVHHA